MLGGLRVEGHEHGFGIEPDRVPVAGHIGAGAADEDEQVGLGETGGHGIGATIAEPPGPRRAAVRQRIVGSPVAEDRNPRRGGERRKVGTAARVPTVSAEDERGTLRCGETGPQGFDLSGRRGRWGRLGEGRGGRFGEADEDVFGQADDDGSGPAGRGDAQGIGGEFAGAVLVVDGDDTFGRRGEPLGQTELREGLAGSVGERDEADEEDECGRILPCGVDGDHRVRRPGPAGDHGDSGAACQSSLGEGHEPGPALLAAHDGLDRGIVEAVEDVEVGLAGDRVDAFDPRVLQGVDDEVAGRVRHGVRPFEGCYLTPAGRGAVERVRRRAQCLKPGRSTLSFGAMIPAKAVNSDRKASIAAAGHQ